MNAMPETETISEADYELIRRIVYEHSRINLGPHKKELVCSRIRKRLKATGSDSIGQYCTRLRRGMLESELVHLIDVTTTNHTYFFRESDHFAHLNSVLLPKLVEEWRSGRRREIRIWSAGCSSGEEPYTLAMVLSEALGPGSALPWEITASDISTRIVARAAEGLYRHDQVASIPEPLIKRHFTAEQREDVPLYRIRPLLRARIRFERFNLIEDPLAGRGPYDIVFCRNVMIYFDRPTQELLLKRLVSTLAPGGHLFVGHAEGVSSMLRGMSTIDPSIFRK